MKAEQKSRWGFGIAALYCGFVLFILACVGFASLQDFDLVEDDYYARGLAYDGQMDKVRRTAQLPSQPEIRYSRQPETVTVTFPEFLSMDKLGGTITLYCPADSRYDRSVPLQMDSTRTVSLAVADLPTGWWKVKIDWQHDGTAYYTEGALQVE